MGMKMSLKGWRDLREINLGTISIGGSQAEKQRHGPQTQLCLQVAEYSQASLLISLDSVFPPIKLGNLTTDNFPDSVSWVPT